MKKTLLPLAVAGFMIAGMASCNKQDSPAAPVTETYNVDLKVGENYTFTLPKNLRNDPYQFTTQAQHASVSQLTCDSSGDPVYVYTPAPGYTGSDQVVVANDQELSQHCPPPPQGQGPPPPPPGQGKHHGKHHDCNGQQEDHYIVTINFNVADTATASVAKNK